MKTRIPTLTLLLLSLSSLSFVVGAGHLEPSEDEHGTDGEHVALQAEGKRLPSASSDLDGIPSSLADSAVKIDPDSSAGLKDAPFDGKDGRPHTGPFVETSAERDRKKAKEVGDDDIGSTKKGLSKPSTHASEYPLTNDGVMDDPNRRVPEEGTRGTEGGVSEKSREREGSLTGSGPEKVPNPPKEAPPLPHSEQEKLGSKEASKKAGESGVDEEDRPKELGGLEVLCPTATKRSEFTDL